MRPFGCSICRKTFGHAVSLEQHMNVHSQVCQPLKCKAHIISTWRTSSNFKPLWLLSYLNIQPFVHKHLKIGQWKREQWSHKILLKTSQLKGSQTVTTLPGMTSDAQFFPLFSNLLFIYSFFWLLSSLRKKVLLARCVGKPSSALRLSPRTCSSTPTRDLTPASSAGRGSTRSLTWKSTRTFTPVIKWMFHLQNWSCLWLLLSRRSMQELFPGVI